MDHHATTPVEPRVLAAMLPYFSEVFGNAASKDHEFGYQANQAVEQARTQIAALINARPDEIIFTSGASVEPSHVIMALGFGEQRAHSSLRFGLGRSNDAEQVAYAVGVVGRHITQLRIIMTL
jgi:cysteine sulfinate desulfinase/cysteine desulfurase-like protein